MGAGKSSYGKGTTGHLFVAGLYTYRVCDDEVKTRHDTFRRGKFYLRFTF